MCGKKRYFCVQITLDNKSDKITKIGECLSQIEPCLFTSISLQFLMPVITTLSQPQSMKTLQCKLAKQYKPEA